MEVRRERYKEGWDNRWREDDQKGEGRVRRSEREGLKRMGGGESREEGREGRRERGREGREGDIVGKEIESAWERSVYDQWKEHNNKNILYLLSDTPTHHSISVMRICYVPPPPPPIE